MGSGASTLPPEAAQLSPATMKALEGLPEEARRELLATVRPRRQGPHNGALPTPCTLHPPGALLK